MVIFVELLRFGVVVARHRVEKLPATIGRAYDNDVILDERHISAHHAVIEEGPDRTPVLRDLGSSNGTLVLGRAVERTPLPDEAVLGGALVRFRGPGTPVPKTILLAGTVGSPVSTARAVVAALLVLLGFFALAELTSSGPRDVPDLASDFLLACVLIAGWAGVWGAATWAVRRTFSFRAHFSIAAFGLAAGLAITPVRRVVIFSLDGERAWPFVNGAFVALLSFAWCWAHVARVGHWRRRSQLAGAVACACAVVLLWALPSIGKQGAFHALPRFYGDMLPPSLRLASPRDPAAFFERSRGLKAEADALAADR